MKWITLLVLVCFSILFNVENAAAQVVQSDIEQYYNQAIPNENYFMYDVQKCIPNIKVDLKYASDDNFMKKKVYNQKKAYLRWIAIKALKKVQKELNKKGFGIKIFDAYRPFYVTKIMRMLSPNKNYVANPKKGSTHNRGVTIDCTIIDLKTGNELDMGTPFDDFSKKASHAYTDFEPQIIHNRKLLRETMEKFGFVALEKEWWHYNLKNPAIYPLMNFDFCDFE